MNSFFWRQVWVKNKKFTRTWCNGTKNKQSNTCARRKKWKRFERINVFSRCGKYDGGSIAYFSRRDNFTWGGFGFVRVYAFFTIDHFNDRVRCLFSIAEVDKGNTPVELNPITEAGKGISPKLTGNEMMTRLICLITLIFTWVCERRRRRRLLGIFVATTNINQYCLFTEAFWIIFRSCMQIICFI